MCWGKTLNMLSLHCFQLRVFLKKGLANDHNLSYLWQTQSPNILGIAEYSKADKQKKNWYTVKLSSLTLQELTSSLYNH